LLSLHKFQLLNIFSISKKSKILSARVLLNSLFVAILELTILIMTASIIALFLSGNYPEIIPKILQLSPVTISVLTLCLYSLLLLFSRFNTALCQKIGVEYSNQLFHAYSSLSYQDFMKSSIGNIQKRIVTDGDRVTGGVIYPCSQILQKTIVAVLILSTVIYNVSFYAYLPFAFILAVYCVVSMCLKGFQRQAGINLTLSLSYRFKIIADKFQLFREARALGEKSFLKNEFDINSHKLASDTRDVIFYADVPRYVIEACVYLVIILSTTQTDFIMSNREDVALVLLGTMRLLPHLQAIFSNYALIQSHRSAVDTKAFTSSMISFPDQKQLGEALTHISLIEFSPIINSKNLCKPVTMELKSDQIIEILGPSGVGKTQFLYCLSGISHEYVGKIAGHTISGQIDMSGVKCSSYFSNSLPIEGSVYDNLNIFSIQHHQENIFRLIHNYKLFPEIKNDLPSIKALLESKYERLSLGQKQRIGVLRTVMQDAELYIFDEPTSALNDELTDAVLRLIKTHLINKIVFISSHQKILKRFANKTITLTKNVSNQNSKQSNGK